MARDLRKDLIEHLTTPSFLGGQSDRIQKRDQTKTVKNAEHEPTTEVTHRTRTTIYRAAGHGQPKEKGDWYK